jgi:hypothetical protein
MKKALSFLVVAFVALVPVIRAADPEDDNQLSKDQKKALKVFRADLAAQPASDSERARHLKVVQERLKSFFSVTNKPSPDDTDILAATMVNATRYGQMNVNQASVLAKEIGKVLSKPEITYQDTNQFVKTIDPLVRSTGLGPNEQLRLYREAMRILTTAPTYTPPGR